MNYSNVHNNNCSLVKMKIKLLKSVPLILTIISHAHQSISCPQVDFDRFEELTEQVGTLLNNCTRLQVNNIAVLSDSNTTMKWTSKSLKRISLINWKIANPRAPFPQTVPWHQKFHIFVIITSSTENLKYMIEGLKNTTLWNRAALYVLVDNRGVENGCKSAHNYLKISWEYDLLSSTYFCVDPVQDLIIYTYNPFMGWAPKSWKRVGSDKMNVRKHIWTLFKKKLIPGVTTCEDITFDKTRTLNGYPLKVLSLQLPPGLFVNLSKHGLDKFGGIDGNILRVIWTKLNVTLNATLYSNTSEHYSYLKNITSGQYDVLLNYHYIFNKPGMTLTYVHIDSGLSILTRFPGYEDGYKMILKYMTLTFLAGILVTFFITGIVLGKYSGRGVANGCLEVLRIMLGVSMKRFPKAVPLRIYLLTVLILFMLTTSIFQGNLSSLLTNPTPIPPIDSMEDLQESGFNIFMLEGYKNSVYDDVLFSRTQTRKFWDCSIFVEKSVACVADKALLMKIAFEKNLYISKHRINTLFAGYIVRPNWPLTDRLSRMLMMMNEGGVVNFVWDNSTSQYTYKLQKMEAEATSKEYHILMLHDVKFAFYILLFGHTIATVVFVGEVLLYRVKKEKIRKRNREKVILPYVH